MTWIRLRLSTIATVSAVVYVTGGIFAPVIAFACEGAGEEVEGSKGTLFKEVRKNGVKVAECNFRVEVKPCEIEFKVTGAGEGWRAETREEKPPEWAKRYKLTAGCVLTKLYKGGEACKDEIVNKEANNTENEYCLLFEVESGAIKKVGGCTKLKE